MVLLLETQQLPATAAECNPQGTTVASVDAKSDLQTQRANTRFKR